MEELVEVGTFLVFESTFEGYAGQDGILWMADSDKEKRQSL